MPPIMYGILKTASMGWCKTSESGLTLDLEPVIKTYKSFTWWSLALESSFCSYYYTIIITKMRFTRGRHGI